MAPPAQIEAPKGQEAYAINSKTVEKAAKYITGDPKTAATVLYKFTRDFTRDSRATEKFFDKIADLNKSHLEGKLEQREFVQDVRKAVDDAFPSFSEKSRDGIFDLMLNFYVNGRLGRTPKKIVP